MAAGAVGADKAAACPAPALQLGCLRRVPRGCAAPQQLFSWLSSLRRARILGLPLTKPLLPAVTWQAVPHGPCQPPSQCPPCWGHWDGFCEPCLSPAVLPGLREQREASSRAPGAQGGCTASPGRTSPHCSSAPAVTAASPSCPPMHLQSCPPPCPSCPRALSGKLPPCRECVGGHGAPAHRYVDEDKWWH